MYTVPLDQINKLIDWLINWLTVEVLCCLDLHSYRWWIGVVHLSVCMCVCASRTLRMVCLHACVCVCTYCGHVAEDVPSSGTNLLGAVQDCLHPPSSQTHHPKHQSVPTNTQTHQWNVDNHAAYCSSPGMFRHTDTQPVSGHNINSQRHTKNLMKPINNKLKCNNRLKPNTPVHSGDLSIVSPSP